MNYTSKVEDHLAIPDYFSGTSGLVLPVPNKQFFPEEYKSSSRLSYYASLFNSIEVNSSFYKIPRARTVANWAESVPENFRFTFKIFKEITHNKTGLIDRNLIRQFMETIDFVGGKKGCLLVQFAAKTVFEFEAVSEMLAYISDLNNNQRWKVCVEFRDKKWYSEHVRSILNKLNVALVIQDIPKSLTPMNTDHSDTVYLRFHGPAGDYRGSYSAEVLHEWATRIHDWVTGKRKVFVYFNNTIGEALQNLQTLNGMVAAISANVMARK